MSRDLSFRGELPPKGEERLMQLQRWVQEDLAAGDASLAAALRNWRDEVLARIPGHRPMMIRVPRIFVSRLNLQDQRVVIGEQDTVCVMVSRRRRRTFETGEVLVPGRNGS